VVHRRRRSGPDRTVTVVTLPICWQINQQIISRSTLFQEGGPRRSDTTVREKFSCRDCEAITQPPEPFHATPRGYIGPQLLATIMFDKFGQHLPLNPQSQRFKCEGIDLSVSTLADQVGAAAFAVMPLFRLIEAHVLAAERLHGDETTVPILAKGKTVTGRIWSYARDDRQDLVPQAPAEIAVFRRLRVEHRPGKFRERDTFVDVHPTSADRVHEAQLRALIPYAKGDAIVPA
jgi:hypothetical protein